MYVRCENRPWKLLGKHVAKGDVLAITPEQLKRYAPLVESGELTVLSEHPDQAKKKNASRRRTRAAKKQAQLKSDESNG